MSSIHSRAMLVSLSISMFSPRKTDKRATNKVIKENNAAEKAAKVIKQILPDEALQDIIHAASEARDYHYEHTCPWTDEGARILPSAKYLDYVAFQRKKRAQFETLRDVFLSKYTDLQEAAKQNTLGSLYNAADYPPLEIVRKKFAFKTDFLPFPTSADFRVDMAEEELTALRSQVESRILEATSTARRDLWERLADPIGKMAKALSDPDKGFHSTLVGNLQAVVDVIPGLNITNDPDLERIRQQVQNELLRHSADRLKRAPITRAETAARANEILATMSGYLNSTDSPSAAPMEIPPPAPVPSVPAVPIVPVPPPIAPKLEILPAGPVVASSPLRRIPGRRIAA